MRSMLMSAVRLQQRKEFGDSREHSREDSESARIGPAVRGGDD